MYHRTETLYVNRTDCIMGLHENPHHKHFSVDLGPIEHFGYTLLINHSTNSNCAFKLCLINNQAKVIVMSTR